MSQMYCPNCAKNLAEGSRFCRGCGLDVRPVRDAMEGWSGDQRGTPGWIRTVIIVVSSFAFCAMAFVFGARPDRWAMPVSTYLGGIAWFAFGAVIAYLKLHPSVQIGYHERVKELIVGFACVFAGGAIALGAQLAGVTTIGLILFGLIAISALPSIVSAGRAVVRAQRALWDDEGEEDEEADSPVSITGMIAQRQAAWQLSPPPSIVPNDGPHDASELPRQSMRRDESQRA
jgi:hypothetical protein